MPGSAPNGDDDTANIKLFQAEPAVRIIFTLQNNKAQIECVLNSNSEIIINYACL